MKTKTITMELNEYDLEAFEAGCHDYWIVCMEHERKYMGEGNHPRADIARKHGNEWYAKMQAVRETRKALTGETFKESQEAHRKEVAEYHAEEAMVGLL